MNSVFQAGLRIGESVSASDLTLLLARLTAIAAAAHLALVFLRRAPAALRHLVAVTALATMLVTPLTLALRPAWPTLAVPVPWLATPAAIAKKARSLERRDESDAGATATAASLEARESSEPAPRTTAPRLAPGASPTAATSARRASRPASPSLASRLAPLAPFAGAAGAALALLLAASLLLSRIAGFFAARRIARSASAVADARVLAQFEHVRRRLGLRGAIPLRVTARLAVPAVVGFARPVLLLPPAALEWSEHRLSLVFLHELAHVRRRDGLGLLIARAATALCWFHPLAWTLARTARRECERACDDVVLLAGARASDYADALLAVAHVASRGGSPAMSLAFARASSLEGRLLAILGTGVRRTPVSRRAIAAAVAYALVLLMPLCAVRVVSAANPSDCGTCMSASTTEITHAFVSTSTVTAQTTSRTVATSLEETPRPDAVVASSSARTWPDLGAAESKTGAQWFGKAKHEYDAGRYATAGEAYERAARAGYRTSTAWYNTACSYSLDGQRNRALGALQSALDEGFDQRDLLQSDTDLNPLRSDGRFRLLVKGELRSDEADARGRALREKYDELVNSRTGDAQSLNSVGIELMRAGEAERAAEAFVREFALDSAATSIYNEACARAVAGQTARALAALESSILEGYGDAEKLRGDPDLTALHEQKRFDELAKLADELSLESKDLNEEDEDGWRSTLPHYERAAREHASSGRAWWNLGYAQLRAADPRASLASFRHALDLGYRRGNTLYNLACAAAQAGDTSAALDWLSRAEDAGMKVRDLAPGDRDLDPLRSDARFRAMIERWRHERSADSDRVKEKRKDK